MPVPSWANPAAVFAALLRAAAAFRERTGVPAWMPFAVVVAFCLLLNGDPFGLEAASGARSSQVTLRIAAPFYAASNHVVAVLIDDDYLRDRKVSWPLRYVEQGSIMRRILAAEPAVLVVDFIYPHRHADGSRKPDDPDPDPIDSLISPLADNADIPVIFTALAREPPHAPPKRRWWSSWLKEVPPERQTGPAEVRCEPGEPVGYGTSLAALTDDTSIDTVLSDWVLTRGPVGYAGKKDLRRLAFIGWSGCADRYPHYFAGDPAAATPAFAAFRAWCEGQPRHPACTRHDPVAEPRAYEEPMMVRSGAYPPEAQKFSYASRCQEVPEGRVPRWRQFIDATQQLAFSLFGDPRNNPDKQVALPCPTVAIVPYSDLVSATPKQWHDLVAGKAVVLGASIAGIPDVVPTAVHGQVAGAVWHAMALDNLLSQGSRYLREPGYWEERAAVVILALLFAYSFPRLVGLYEHAVLKEVLAGAGLLAWLALAAVYLYAGEIQHAVLAAVLGISLDLVKPTYSAAYFFALLIAAAASFLLSLIGVSVGNWIGLMLVIAGFSHTMKSYYKGEGRKRLPHPLSVLWRIWIRRVRHAVPD